MKIRIGIVGYGNLGKAVEREVLKNNKYKLVAIFSRRNVKSISNTTIEPFENFVYYKTKIDIMLLCGSSKSDIMIQSPKIAKHFDTINTFDTHKNIQVLHKSLNEICLKNNKRAIICTGWDPGLFSVVRGLFLAISGESPYTFWGKGISLGHSDAIRSVDGVIDGVEFTIPNREAIKIAKANKNIDIPMHFRECFVYANDNYKEIEKTIKNIPNYFKGQPTKVNFVSNLELIKLRKNLSHKGYIFSKNIESNKKTKLSFSVTMNSNPEFTARIMTCYLSAIINLKNNNSVGAFTPLDIPISYLFTGIDKENLLTTICWHLLFTIIVFSDKIYHYKHTRNLCYTKSPNRILAKQ